MSDFKAKMHQIRFRLGELSALPSTTRGLLLRGKGGNERGQGGKEGIRKKERGGREKGEGRGGDGGEGWEGKFREGEREGEGVGKRGGEGREIFGGPGPPKYFFLEPRLITILHSVKLSVTRDQ